MKIKTDYLVIGSGLAGLSMAVKAAEFGHVILIAKSELHEFKAARDKEIDNACVPNKEAIDLLKMETQFVGNGLCNPSIVDDVLSNSAQLISELKEWGAKLKESNLDSDKEVTEKSFHRYAEETGHEIQRVLLNKIEDSSNITVYNNHFAVDLITQHHLGQPVKRTNPDIECYGAYILNMDSGKINTFFAKSTFLATGGAGNLFMNTTYSPTNSGDGIAMMYRAKGLVDNMEFIKFHPMAFYQYSKKPDIPIPFSLLKEGAILRTIDGEEFLHKYQKREHLTEKDFVARAIDSEIKVTGEDHVLLDCTNIIASLKKGIYRPFINRCKKAAIDITKEPLPVVPAAQYVCGGISVNRNARTSIKNLYAVGECSDTGLHGANVLEYNSLIEALYFAREAIKDALENQAEAKLSDTIPEWNDEGTSHPEEMVLITQNLKEVQRIMSVYVGIGRSEIRLKRALKRLWVIYNETEELYQRSRLSKPLCELRNLINVAYIIIKHAMSRKESLGLHYMNS